MESTVDASHEFSGRDQTDLPHWLSEAEKWLNRGLSVLSPSSLTVLCPNLPRGKAKAEKDGWARVFCQVSFFAVPPSQGATLQVRAGLVEWLSEGCPKSLVRHVCAGELV